MKTKKENKTLKSFSILTNKNGMKTKTINSTLGLSLIKLIEWGAKKRNNQKAKLVVYKVQKNSIQW